MSDWHLYFFGDGFEDVFSVADDLQAPVEFEVELFFGAHLPGNGGVAAYALGGAEEAEGSADRDVETLGEAVHRDFDVAVGAVDGFVGEACQFGAEDECHGAAEVEVANHCVVFVRQGGDDAVALVVQVSVGFFYVAVLVVVHPLAAAHGDIAGGVEGIAVLDNVHILNAEAVATAQHGTGVVRLVDVFKHHGDVACAVLHQPVEEAALVVGIELAEGFVEPLFLFVCVLVEKTWSVDFTFGHGGIGN